MSEIWAGYGWNMGETWVEYNWSMDEMLVEYGLNMGKNEKYVKFGILLYGYVCFIIWNDICKLDKFGKRNSSLLQDKNKEYIASKHIFVIWRSYLGEV